MPSTPRPTAPSSRSAPWSPSSGSRSAGPSSARTSCRASSIRRRSPEVAAILAARPRADWLAFFGHEACVAPVNSPAEAQRDPHVRARGLIVGEGEAAHAVSALRAASGAEDGQRAPGLGDDTLDILAAAGYGAGEVAALEAAGIVAGAATPEATARAARLGTALARLASRSRPG